MHTKGIMLGTMRGLRRIELLNVHVDPSPLRCALALAVNSYIAPMINTNDTKLNSKIE